MLKMLKRLAKNESGATAVEYGILVGVIAAGVIVVAGNVGGDVANAFTNLHTKLSTNLNFQ